ncbi:MAG: hypothetical protein IKV79_04070 [Oscillospiraceae bacterium]|nr:hypothetical protein [Oscillospiraceae bacterium]
MRDFEIFAYSPKLFHRGQSLAGGNIIINIATAVAKVIDHLIFADTFLKSQLSDSIPYKFFVHIQVTP